MRLFPQGPRCYRATQHSVFSNGAWLILSVGVDSFGDGISFTRWVLEEHIQMSCGPPALTEILLMLGFDLTNEMEDHVVIKISPISAGTPSHRLYLPQDPF